MSIFAGILLGFFALGYLVLGAADIGVGMLLPFLARSDAERRLVIATIAPFFLGNEVWLVSTIGLLAGAFPAAESSLLHGLYPAVAALLVAWVVRDMGLWLRGRRPARLWRFCCDAVIVSGSWAFAAAWGVVLGSVIDGVTDHVVVTPGILWVSAAVVVLFALHGLAFAAIRLSGDLRARARRLSTESGERAVLTVTSLALVILGVLAGAHLDLTGSAADGASLAFLLPAVAAVVPLLVLAQSWLWWTFRHRVTGPSYL